MKKLALMILILTSPAFATVYNFTPATANGTITADLALGSGGGNTYNFAAGTYSQMGSSSWTFPCVGGNVFQGAAAPFVVGAGISPTTIIALTARGSAGAALTGNNTYTTPGNGCTIQYFGFYQNNIYVGPPVSGLLLQYNKFYGIPAYIAGTGNTTSYAAVYFDNGTAQDIGYSLIQWNQFGPSCADVIGSATDLESTCGGVVMHGSNVNLTIQNNQFFQINEGVHALAQGTNGQIGTNLSVLSNDFNQVHRISIEIQQQQVSGDVIAYNSIRNPYLPAGFSFGMSAACCSSVGGSSSGAMNIHDNLIDQENPLIYGATYSYGYGIELWGNGSIANNNVIQGPLNGNSIALGGSGGNPSTSLVVTNNTLQGAATSPVCEAGGTYPTSCTNVGGTNVTTGNTGSTAISAQTSTAPTISPSTGNKTFPLTVTLTDAGANTSIWYTTDGSIPFPGQGTATLYTGTFTCSNDCTVKAVGMWGTGANPLIYRTGYGWVPSAVASATYTSGTKAANPTVIQ